MACQPVADIHSFEARAHITRRRIQVTMRYIHRIETAKALVCGVPSGEAINKLRRDFEALLPLIEEGLRLLNGGWLDAVSDEKLRDLAATLKMRDTQMTDIFDGALRIGLGAVEPFPQLLAKFKALQERLQSTIEGILLSLSGSFQELVEKSTQEITVRT